MCRRCEPCICPGSGWRWAGRCGLQTTPCQNVLDDIFLKLRFLVTLLFSLKRVTLLQEISPCLLQAEWQCPLLNTLWFTAFHTHTGNTNPLRRDCRQYSCQHIRCHSIAPHKHPAFTLFIFPPVQAATAHKHAESLIYIYNKSPFCIPRSGKEPWYKRNLLREQCNSSKEKQAHLAFCR